MTQETTIFEKYKELKEKHPKSLLLFRVGDFYEAYDEDATKAGKILGVTVTRKLSSKVKGSDGLALKIAGFPYHSLDTFLPKLIRAGERIAICDDLNEVTEKCSPSIPGAETNMCEEIKASEDIDTLKAQHKREIEELKSKLQEQERSNLDVVQRIISESIKALKGELPDTLAEYFYSSLGKLEVIKMKNNLNYRLTKNEINYLIGEASNSQNKQKQ